MNFATYDIETNGEDKVTCAALTLPDKQTVFWTSAQEVMTQEEVRGMVLDLQAYRQKYTLVTFNGLGFDFRVLAGHSGIVDVCSEMALNHIDIMWEVFCRKGHWLSQKKSCEGMGVTGKLTEVTLSDGTVLQEMSGALAPELWQKGEREAVLTYLQRDTESLLDLALALKQAGKLQWISNTGRLQTVPIQLLPVLECLKIPEPYTGWMSDPPKRSEMIAWTGHV